MPIEHYIFTNINYYVKYQFITFFFDYLYPYQYDGLKLIKLYYR